MGKIILWIQSVPETNETILSVNGSTLQPGSSKYLKCFAAVTSKDLQKYATLSPTLKRLTVTKSHFFKPTHRYTYLSGHFTQKDSSNRLICYRSLIIDASDETQEWNLLEKESKLYGCTLSDEDKDAIKKKNNNHNYVIVLIILLTLITIWIIISQRMS